MSSAAISVPRVVLVIVKIQLDTLAVPAAVTLGMLRAVYEIVVGVLVVHAVISSAGIAVPSVGSVPADQAVISSAGIAVPSVGAEPTEVIFGTVVVVPAVFTAIVPAGV